MQPLQSAAVEHSTIGECDLPCSCCQAGAREVHDAVDLGCATGLSSMHVSRAVPSAQVTGCDLSPHMIAVGRHLQQRQVGEMPEVMRVGVLPLHRCRLVTQASNYHTQ